MGWEEFCPQNGKCLPEEVDSALLRRSHGATGVRTTSKGTLVQAISTEIMFPSAISLTARSLGIPMMVRSSTGSCRGAESHRIDKKAKERKQRTCVVDKCPGPRQNCPGSGER